MDHQHIINPIEILLNQQQKKTFFEFEVLAHFTQTWRHPDPHI
jgi:hypothetical protein